LLNLYTQFDNNPGLIYLYGLFILLKKTTTAHIAVLIANLFFAINYNFVKHISPSPIRPYGLNLIRVGSSLVLFWLLWLFAKDKTVIERKDSGRFILCGLFGVVLNQTLFIKGLTMTSAIHASLLTLLTPILINVFAFWILKEKATFLKAAGLFLGISGSVMLIVSKQNVGQPKDYLIGDILVILNAISYTIYFILVKPLMEKYSPLQVIRGTFTFGFIMMLPIGWAQFGEIQWEQLIAFKFWTLFFVVFAGTFLAYVFNVYGIRVLGTGVTGAYIYIQIVLAGLIAIIFFNEQLTFQKIIASLLIFTGVFLVSYKRSGLKKMDSDD
jgi:drug/metabolite transporter (DMT)-like permease